MSIKLMKTLNVLISANLLFNIIVYYMQEFHLKVIIRMQPIYVVQPILESFIKSLASRSHLGPPKNFNIYIFVKGKKIIQVD